MNHNAADPKHLQKQKLRQNFNRKQELDDMRFMLDHPAGRRMLWRMLGQFRVSEISFTGNSTTFFNEGIRSAGLFVLGEIMEAKPEAYILMMQESKKREETNG